MGGYPSPGSMTATRSARVTTRVFTPVAHAGRRIARCISLVGPEQDRRDDEPDPEHQVALEGWVADSSRSVRARCDLHADHLLMVAVRYASPWMDTRRSQRAIGGRTCVVDIPTGYERSVVRSTSPRVVVVTGASAGVGRATARAFARSGAALAVLARGSDGLDATRKELVEMGARVIAVPTDVADAAQVSEAASRTEAELGAIDVWVNDAMTTVFSPGEAITPEEFRRVTEVTYLGTVYGTLEALNRMRPRDRGVIVQVGSALSYRAIPLQSAYCGAKHGVRGFTDSLRCELRHERSHVSLTMVQLPAMNTPQVGWSRSRLRR